MPLTAAGIAPAPAAAQSASPFLPPDSPMLLSRTTRRPLPDGKEVLARRSYEVRFTRDGEGYRIDGKLVDVLVQVPPRLEALAEIERRRPDEGLFPLRIDASGRLVAGGNPRPTEETHRAIDAVAGMVDKSRLAAAEKAQAKAFVLALHQRPGYNSWPADVFRPVPGLRREVRAVPMVDGAAGEITVEITASATEPGGLLVALTRTITSDLQGDRRTTHEEWALAPL